MLRIVPRVVSDLKWLLRCFDCCVILQQLNWMLVLRNNEGKVGALGTVDTNNERAAHRLDIVHLEIRMLQIDRDHLRFESRTLHVVFFPRWEPSRLSEVNIEIWISCSNSGKTHKECAINTGRLILEVLEFSFFYKSTNWCLRHQLLQVNVD